MATNNKRNMAAKLTKGKKAVGTKGGAKVPKGSMRQPPNAPKPKVKLNQVGMGGPLGQFATPSGIRPTGTPAAIRAREAAAAKRGKAKEFKDPKATPSRKR